MIYELRTYTIRTGGLADQVKAASTLSREIRGDNYGKLEGYWQTEIGPLNQVMHLWSYSDLNERTRLRGELSKNARWTGEYLKATAGLVVRQDIRLLNAIRPPVAPATTGNIYEFRYYRCKTGGGVRNWLELYTKVLPQRETYSKISGLFQTEAGQPNEVCHIWAYPDLNARAAVRGAVAKDPAWQEFLKASAQHVEEQHALIMLPAPHSPMK